MDDGEKRARFHAMTEGTTQDWETILAALRIENQSYPQRLLAHMSLLRSETGGFAVDRLEHCLQTATRAHQDGRDEEYVVCALCTTSATSSGRATMRTSRP